jgi:hypothetical protein
MLKPTDKVSFRADERSIKLKRPGRTISRQVSRGTDVPVRIFYSLFQPLAEFVIPRLWGRFQSIDVGFQVRIFFSKFYCEQRIALCGYQSLALYPRLSGEALGPAP